MFRRCLAASAASVLILSVGCEPEPDPIEEPTPEEEEPTPEEEDPTPDPGLTADGITFNFTMDITAEDVGDDDDSADGDGERGTAYHVTTQHSLTYWLDLENGIEACTQVVETQGEAWFGFGVVADLGVDESCNVFGGFVELDPTTYVDVSNPALEPDHCDPVELADAGLDYGMRMLSPADPNATPPTWGDFLSFGYVPAETHRILGTSLYADADQAGTAAALDEQWAGFGLEYVGAAFLPRTPGSAAASLGLEVIANPVGQGCDWLAGWELFKSPEANEHVGEDLIGQYGGQAGFLLTLAAGD